MSKDIRIFKHTTPKGNEVNYLHEVVIKDGVKHRMVEPLSVEDLLDNPRLLDSIKESFKKPVIKA